MRIGIIGAGHIGGALARRFAALGHEVSIANSRSPETLEDLEAASGAKAVTAAEAAKSGEVVVVTIPLSKVPALAGLFQGVADDVVVIDTNNYYPRERDGRIEGIEAGATESRWVEDQLGRRVVKVFNNIYARHILEKGQPAGAPNRIALPVAGDDPAAKRTVLDLVDAIGFDAVDAGGIDESWRQQPGSPVYGTDLDRAGVERALREATRERTPQWSGTQSSPGDPVKPD